MNTHQIPAEPGDLLIQGWEASGCGDFVNRMELEFDTALDETLLNRSIELLLDAEPILRSRLVVSKKPHWQVDAGPSHSALSIASGDAEFERFRDLPFDPGVQLEVCVQHRTGGDRLMLKVPHQVADGGSAIMVAYRLAVAYSGLAADEGFRLPSLAGNRGLDQIFDALSARARISIVWELLRVIRRCYRPTAALPSSPGPDEPWVTVQRRIDPDRVSAITAYGRERQVTLNDMFIAAYFRSLAAYAKWDGARQIALPMTLDLGRWHLQPRNDAIRNLAAIEIVFLGRELGADFEATLAKVGMKTRSLKGPHAGLPMARLLRWRTTKFLLDGMPVTKTKPWLRPGVPPAFTNFGPIDKQALAFAGVTPRMAHVWPSSLRWPGLVVGLSGYDGNLTLLARTAASAEADVAAILDGVLAELPR